MSWAACCSNKQMQDMFFGESSGAMFRDAAKGRREACCQWCYEAVQMFVVGKSLVWICDNCKGTCEACEKCGQPVSAPRTTPAATGPKFACAGGRELICSRAPPILWGSA
jgi:hypothetical protein